jgi:hypothetical protein
MTVSEIARTLGRRGGRARAARLSIDERRRIAALGGKARRDALTATNRVVANLRYAAAMRGLQKAMPVERLSRFDGRLPGARSTTG